jgi:YhcN/YlaJ family sporulation lipoprotein
MLFAGCAPARRPAPPNPPNTQDQVNPKNNPRPESVFPADAREANRIAEKLADEAAKVEGVNSATVVLSRNTVIVGLDLKANLEADKTNAIKREVINRIKKADKRAKKVIVTTDADTVARIKKVAKGIAEGRPVSEFAKELAEITRRITPAVK